MAIVIEVDFRNLKDLIGRMAAVLAQGGYCTCMLVGEGGKDVQTFSFAGWYIWPVAYWKSSFVPYHQTLWIPCEVH